MSYVLFALYLVLCSWLVTRIRFFRQSGINEKMLVLLFIVRVAAGCTNAWITYRLSPVADTFIFHKEGLIEYNLLFSNPGEYFTNIFHNGYGTGYGAVFSSNMSYWNDLTSNLVIKLLSVCNLFSFGHYYVNVILFNFLLFFGCVGVYKIFNAIYKDGQTLLIIGCFLLPSFLFYSTAIHKDGLIYAAVGMLSYHLFKGFKSGRFSVVKMIYIFLLSVFIFLQRNYVFMAILPAGFAYAIVMLKQTKPWLTFGIIYLISLIAFFGVVKIHPALDLPQMVVNKQQDFIHLPKANTAMAMDSLQPNITGFTRNLPQAFNHSFMRPYITDMNESTLILPLALELLCYELLIIVFIFFRKRPLASDPFIFFSVWMALSVLLLIGYIVPATGSIVRYRSVFLPFLLVPVIYNINWKKLQSIVKLKNN